MNYFRKKTQSETKKKTFYTTIVTCYFNLNSKHSKENYKQWIHNMLSNIETGMVIFTDEESYDYIVKSRGQYLKNTHIIITSLDRFHTNQYQEDWVRHHKLFDPEKAIHSPELYMVWAEKSHFLKQSIQMNTFESDYFMWCDIGCFRNRQQQGDIPLDKIKHFPLEEKVKKCSSDKVYLTQTGPFHPLCYQLGDDGLTKIEFTHISASIGGTIFLGHKDILLKWHDVYYNTIQTFIKKNRFIGKDQNIMANITISHPEMVFVIKASHNDPWFFFHWLFT